ncbi:tumor necrosis factor ligand superfamily member 15 [Dendrobates tinctorius]|uniref:tumor necrosis factor ligand superfamily member 15 n=1 Tax=Dendrobates tinctorius TaxID=92724 RepID=UPI003CCA18F9
MPRREEMLQEDRNYITSSSESLRIQDRSIRRLKWAVAFCFILLTALVLFAVFLLRGDFPDKRDKGQMDKQQGTNPDSDKRPKAHLTGTRQTDVSAEDLQWEATRGLAFLRNGMIYSNKSIIIPEEGFYFVYSQLSFRPPSNVCIDDKTISQYIKKFNPNYPEPETILSGISFCTNKKYQPIYLGGLIHLYKNEQLKVHISPGTPLDTSVEHKTFFGAFLV